MKRTKKNPHFVSPFPSCNIIDMFLLLFSGIVIEHVHFINETEWIVAHTRHSGDKRIHSQYAVIMITVEEFKEFPHVNENENIFFPFQMSKSKFLAPEIYVRKNRFTNDVNSTNAQWRLIQIGFVSFGAWLFKHTLPDNN